MITLVVPGKAAVWDLAEPESIQHLHDLWKASKGANSLVEGETSAILVEAAANCSSASRSTPLHIAAMHDNRASIEVNGSYTQRVAKGCRMGLLKITDTVT
jgi:hypothetical protein